MPRRRRTNATVQIPQVDRLVGDGQQWSYVVPGINTTMRAKLEEHHVPFSNWAQAILINGRMNLESAAAALGATIKGIRITHANFGEVLLNFPADGYPAPVTVESNRLDWTRFFARSGRVSGENTQTPENRRQERLRNYQEKRLADAARESDPSRQAYLESQRRYVEACRTRIEEVKEQARSLGVPAFEQLRIAESRFIEATRQLKFAHVSNSEEALRMQFAHELIALQMTDKVVEVKVVPNGVLAYTSELLTNPDPDGNRHRIGEFMIWIRLGGADAGIYWFNKTRRINGARNNMNAPYIYADGRASSDTVTMSLLELVGRYELSAAVDLAIQYVENIDEQNPLTLYLENWPVE